MNLIFSYILTTRDAANKMHVMMGTWFGIKRYILCKRIFNRAYLTCLIMYEYVWHKWNKVKLKKDLPTLTSTWSVDAKILHIYLLLTRCSEKLFDLSFLFYVHTIAAYLNYKDIIMAHRGRKNIIVWCKRKFDLNTMY